MLEPAGRLQDASLSVTGRDRTSAWGTPVFRWPMVLAVTVLLLALTQAAYQGVEHGRPSVAPAVPAHHPPRANLQSLPLAAQSAASAAFGAESPAYRVIASGSGFRAVNPAQQLTMGFAGTGVSISSGGANAMIGLRAMGYGASLAALGEATPRVHANRVVYSHGVLKEWYANGPLGLEQGFSILRRPQGRPRGLLTLAMAVSGNAHASLATGAESITLSLAGRPALRYTGLTATDAHGRVLPSWLDLHRGRMLLYVDVSGARYPLSIDPFVQQGSKLTGTGEIGAGEFGWNAALSADGNTALVSGRWDNSRVGAVWVFTRTGATWSQQGSKLTGGGEIGKAEFGRSVALSADGNTALIGGPEDNSDAGAAWVFTRSGSTWTQQGEKLTGGGETAKGEFGFSVALSSDGKAALIGGLFDGTEQHGSAWVFTRSGSTWTQQGEKFTGSGLVFQSQFGTSVSLSSNGNTALIGGPGGNTGAAWVFTRSGSTWTQQGEKLAPSDATGTGVAFGFSVALSYDGNTALIGGLGDNSFVGAGWVFTRSGSTWTQQGPKLTGAGGSGQAFLGESVALSGDGNTALLGGFFDNSGIGAAWVFTRSGSTWTQQASKLTGGGETGNGEFGKGVALSADAATAMIGGPGDNKGAGAAWVFVSMVGPFVDTSSLPDATRGMAYKAELAASGGVPPYKWKKVGAFPKGLKLSKTGVISGTPSNKLSPGSYPLSVKVTDSKKKSATATLTLKIN